MGGKGTDQHSLFVLLILKRILGLPERKRSLVRGRVACSFLAQTSRKPWTSHSVTMNASVLEYSIFGAIALSFMGAIGNSIAYNPGACR